jgi:hypothetical protein
MNTPCCIYNGIFSPASAIYPKNGKWSFNEMYDILLDCENDVDLMGVKPLDICEGGFQWDGTQESIDLWHRTTLARERPREECKMEQQIRTYYVDCHWLDRDYINNWKEELPNHVDFTQPMRISKHQIGTLEIPYIYLKCKGNPSFNKYIKLLKLFVKHGHTLIKTEGFSIDFTNDTVRKCKAKKYVFAKELREMLKHQFYTDNVLT